MGRVAILQIQTPTSHVGLINVLTFYWQRSPTLQVIINPGSLLTLIQ